MPGIVSVLTPSSSTALSSLDSAKLELGLSNNCDDLYVIQLISRASAVVQSYIGRSLGTQTIQETFRPAGCNFYGLLPYNNFANPLPHGVHPLILSYCPVLSVASVTVDGTALTANTDFEIEPASGLLWRLFGSSRTPWAGSAIVANYTAGYVLPQDTGTRTLPYEIEDAVLGMVKADYYNRGIDPSIVLEVTEGVGRTAYNKTAAPRLSDDIKTALQPYRTAVW